MKLITAIIQPFMTDRLARALRKSAVTGYTVTDVSGSGRDLSLSPDYLKPRVKFEIVANEPKVQEITKLIVDTVGRHREGDGVIYVTDVVNFINVQTGQIDHAALQVD
ncbi:MAG: P-II family nitrogen regulator [Candidatus Melainabacteria bacterium]|nr:P-II family nitrogen regulator [Candidatus Melainabacteria bacterium]